MGRGVNKVILLGHLGRDPELRYTQNGSAVANVTIATSNAWKDKQTGENQEKTEWHRVVFFNRLAEIVNEYLKKGSQIYIEGKLNTRKWQDQSGMDRYTIEIIANEMQMLGKSVATSETGSSSLSLDQSKQSDTYPNSINQKGSISSTLDDFDDDIPF